jgi:hypothetical protein
MAMEGTIGQWSFLLKLQERVDDAHAVNFGGERTQELSLHASTCPPFAKYAKDGPPRVLMLLARSKAWATCHSPCRLSSNALKLLTYGITRNCLLLFRLTPFVITVTNPVVAPLGTTAVK